MTVQVAAVVAGHPVAGAIARSAPSHTPESGLKQLAPNGPPSTGWERSDRFTYDGWYVNIDGDTGREISHLCFECRCKSESQHKDHKILWVENVLGMPIVCEIHI